MDHIIVTDPSSGNDHLEGDWVLIANEIHLDNPATGCAVVLSDAPRQAAAAGTPLCSECGSRVMRALDPRLGGDESHA